MGTTTAPPPKPGEDLEGARAVRIANVGVLFHEPLEEGEFVPRSGLGKAENQAKGTQANGFKEQARAFWKVKTDENHAASAGMQLRFQQGLVVANEICVSEEVWSRASADWMYTLVGWIFGTLPPLGELKGCIRAKWGDESMISVSVLKPWIFVFKFAKEEDCNRVLEQGPWSFDSRPLVLKPWSPDESFWHGQRLDQGSARVIFESEIVGKLDVLEEIGNQISEGKQNLKVLGDDGSGEAESSQYSIFPETVRDKENGGEAEVQGPTSICEGKLSFSDGVQVSDEISKDSIDSEGNFTEVKKNRKKKKLISKGAERELPIGRNKWTQHSKGKGAQPQ
ncbi:hypothetical protein QQ045_008568 [Rhodiola kirilowii]